MAVVLRSNMPYRGNLADLPPINAPMPVDAAFYGDFLSGLFITQAARGADPATIFTFAGMRERYVRNAAGGYYLAAAGSASRVGYGPTGQPLGMLVEAANTQLIAPAQRTDLTQGVGTGLSVVAGAATTNAWDRWFTLTPSGDAAHDLALASSASIGANFRRAFAIELKTAGHRYVQLSSGTPGEATDYANFDLQTKTVTFRAAGASFAGIIPTAEGAICYIQYTSAIAGVEAPTVSIIADGAAGKQAAAAAASVGPVLARLPKLRSANDTPARTPPRSPMPGTANTVLTDRLNLQPAVLTSDFTMLVRARNPEWVNAFTPTLFSLGAAQTSGTGASLRVDTSGEIALVTRTSGASAVAWDASAVLPPGAITTFAFAKQGNVLRIALPNGESYEGTLTQIEGAQPFILSSPVESEGFDGHLQRIIGWSHGKTLAQLQALVAEGL